MWTANASADSAAEGRAARKEFIASAPSLTVGVGRTLAHSITFFKHHLTERKIRYLTHALDYRIQQLTGGFARLALWTEFDRADGFL